MRRVVLSSPRYVRVNVSYARPWAQDRLFLSLMSEREQRCADCSSPLPGINLEVSLLLFRERKVNTGGERWVSNRLANQGEKSKTGEE